MKINNYLYYKDTHELTPEERKGIHELILKSFKNSRLKFYETVVYFKDSDNKIIGFVGLYYIDKYLSLNQLCVEEEHRNNGIASLLLELIFYLYNTTSIILYIDKNKEKTNYLFDFYSRKGFKEIDYLKTFNLSYDRKVEFLMIREPKHQ
jgi:ribosomal protein S18 acetylase RimI-like enzyme